MEKFKIYLYSGIVIIVIVIAIYIWGKKDGQKVNTNILPNQTDWGKSLTQEESDTIARLADEVRADTDGWKISVFGIGAGHDESIYQELSGVSERILVGVANQFATRYKTSLVETLSGEWFSWQSFEFQGYVTGIIDRLKKNKVQ
ncbi:MAG: hypothetical protein WCJ03_12110 [Bacteroidales bacterium]